MPGGRPAINVGPQNARVLQFQAFAARDAKPGLAIGIQRFRVVNRVGVENQNPGATGKAALDCAVEQPRPDTPANPRQGETEELDFVLQKFEIADQVGTVAADMQLVAWLRQQLPAGAALRTDSTRVVSYRQPVSTLLTSLDVRIDAHTMSHYPGKGPEYLEASEKRDRAQSELLAGLLDKLKAVAQTQSPEITVEAAWSLPARCYRAHASSHWRKVWAASRA